MTTVHSVGVLTLKPIFKADLHTRRMLAMYGPDWVVMSHGTHLSVKEGKVHAVKLYSLKESEAIWFDVEELEVVEERP